MGNIVENVGEHLKSIFIYAGAFLFHNGMQNGPCPSSQEHLVHALQQGVIKCCHRRHQETGSTLNYALEKEELPSKEKAHYCSFCDLSLSILIS